MPASQWGLLLILQAAPPPLLIPLTLLDSIYHLQPTYVNPLIDYVYCGVSLLLEHKLLKGRGLCFF